MNAHSRHAAAAALAVAALLTAAAPALGHGGVQPQAAPKGSPERGISLRGCLMTVALVPRPADDLRAALPSPPDLTQTFYGGDPLVSLWGLRCRRADVAGVRARRVALSLVAVPTRLTDPKGVPLANNFTHRLARMDTSSRTLALKLRRHAVPAHLAPAMGGGSGEVRVPGQYRMRAAAELLDNPHDHVNRFELPRPGGRTTSIGLETQGAVDRFCFPSPGGCAASVRVTPRSAVARLLGSTAPPVKAVFDHRRITRLDLPIRTRRTGG
jgi:hypothetical protein